MNNIKNILIFTNHKDFSSKVKEKLSSHKLSFTNCSDLKVAFDLISSESFDVLIFETYGKSNEIFYGINEHDLEVLLYFSASEKSQNRHMRFLPIDKDEVEANKAEDIYETFYENYLLLLPAVYMQDLQIEGLFIDEGRKMLFELVDTLDSACDHLDGELIRVKGHKEDLTQETNAVSGKLDEDESFSRVTGKSEEDESFSRVTGKSEEDESFSRVTGKSEEDESFSRVTGKSEEDESFSRVTGKSEEDESFTRVNGEKDQEDESFTRVTGAKAQEDDSFSRVTGKTEEDDSITRINGEKIEEDKTVTHLKGEKESPIHKDISISGEKDDHSKGAFSTTITAQEESPAQEFNRVFKNSVNDEKDQEVMTIKGEHNSVSDKKAEAMKVKHLEPNGPKSKQDGEGELESGHPEPSKDSKEDHHDIDARNDHGQTPLMLFCLKGEKDKAMDLIKAGAKTSLRCKKGLTVLHYACAHPDNLELVEYLVDVEKLKLSTRDSEGLDPLAIAIKRDCPETVKWLVAHGARTTSKINGQPLLHFAAAHNSFQSFLVLLSLGLPLNQKCNLGLSLEGYCKKKRKLPFLKALKAYTLLNTKKEAV